MKSNLSVQNLRQSPILVTGGCGFIGSNFILNSINNGYSDIINLDLLTYAGNGSNLTSIENHSGYVFIHGDICDENLVSSILAKYKPSAIIHFAAESHVDRSIHAPDAFLKTNVYGTFNLLNTAYNYWKNLNDPEKALFRFLHVSTDEVYGSLGSDDLPFTESNAYQPNSPYSASKAASDHFVRAWHHTYGFPVLTTNCSNNYGPFQFPEKLIPLVISHAIDGKLLPIYGDGKNIRDWLYVRDHCDAINVVLNKGKIGEVYNIGGCNEITNIEIVNYICELLDILRPLTEYPLKHPMTNAALKKYNELVTFVKDRPGHDRRYAIDAKKIEKELGWSPKETFKTGIEKTIQWYLDNDQWLKDVKNGSYQKWLKKNYNP